MLLHGRVLIALVLHRHVDNLMLLVVVVIVSDLIFNRDHLLALILVARDLHCLIVDDRLVDFWLF